MGLVRVDTRDPAGRHYDSRMSTPQQPPLRDDHTQQPPLVAVGEDGALFTVDATGAAEDTRPETGGQKAGRVLLGTVLVIVGVALALGCLLVYVLAWMNLDLWEWIDLIGWGLLFVGVLFLGVAFIGIQLIRRGRRVPAQLIEDALSLIPDDGQAQPTTVLSADASAPTAPAAPKEPPKSIV